MPWLWCTECSLSANSSYFCFQDSLPASCSLATQLHNFPFYFPWCFCEIIPSFSPHLSLLLCHNPHITPISIQKCKSHSVQRYYIMLTGSASSVWLAALALSYCLKSLTQVKWASRHSYPLRSSKCCYLWIPSSFHRETVDWRIALNMSVSADRRPESNYKANQFRQDSIHSRALTCGDSNASAHTQTK